MKNLFEGALYAVTSANLYNFLGNTDFESHIEIFRSTVANSSKAHDDIVNYNVEKLVIIDEHGLLSNDSTMNPIFVSFHTGSYNMLSAYFLKNGKNVNVLADTLSMKVPIYSSAEKLYREKYKNNCSIEMLNVEEEGSIFRIIRKIKNGGLTLAYLDGNNGIGGQSNEVENLLKVNFLNGVVKIRKGLSLISYLTGSPLVVVLNYSDNGVDYLKVFDPIYVVDKNDILSIQSIFNIFENHVKKYYTQWSNWPYIHHSSDLNFIDYTDDIQDMDLTKSYTFNEELYCKVKIDKTFYLFNRKKYKLLPVQSNYEQLLSYKESTETKNNLLKDLISKKDETVVEMIKNYVFI